MPHLRFRGVSRETVKQLSKSLVDTLAPLAGSPREHFTLEFIPAEFVHQGHVVAGYPFVEVFWFERPLEVQDRVAAAITEALRARVGDEPDVAVVFTRLEGRNYYENGGHFG
ncbi:DUF1904 domain-containing protein [Zobellella endophytica]|uniref:DUF1904 domain-containing protein n=1 Tax=Zobellella endophytica TaxID=2116700 RepID=A0A2P7R7V7_9GAMM|nr:DUF1904 domain-containing protein [Zobellella endophytica]PSJ46296.1 DUF1904 domain-containing protein [Zobellella endophytica]